MGRALSPGGGVPGVRSRVSVGRPAHRKRPGRAGFFEHAKGLGRSLRWAWVTWWWAIRILPFWRKVRVESRPRPRRAVIWVLVVLLGPALVGGVVGGVTRPLAFMAGPPGASGVSFATDMETCLCVGFESFVEHASLGVIEMTVSRPIAVVGSRGMALVPSPVGPVSRGTYRFGFATAWDLNVYFWRPWVFAPFWREPPVLRDLIIKCFIAGLAPPAALLVLPFARRTAKLRKSQVVRAWAFSNAVVVPLVFAEVLRGAVSSHGIYGGWGTSIGKYTGIDALVQTVNTLSWFILAAECVWIGVWWWVALGSYRWPPGERIRVAIAMGSVFAAYLGAVFLPAIAFGGILG